MSSGTMHRGDTSRCDIVPPEHGLPLARCGDAPLPAPQSNASWRRCLPGRWRMCWSVRRSMEVWYLAGGSAHNPLRAAEVWIFWTGQPGGLPAGSRWSPRGKVGTATTGLRRRNGPAPRQGCQTRDHRGGFRCSQHRGGRSHSAAILAPAPGCGTFGRGLPVVVPLCPKRPPATFWQPSGLSRQSVASKMSKLRERAVPCSPQSGGISRCRFTARRGLRAQPASWDKRVRGLGASMI